MACAIGMDLGGTKLAGALVDGTGAVLASLRYDTPATGNPADVFTLMRRCVRELLAQAGERQVVGIGLGMPGLLDREQGLSVFSPNLGWRNVPILSEFTEFGLPVDMDNDVRCHTLGELHFGAGRGCTDFSLITLGTGIGSGLVLRGELYRGSGGMAGEIGHVVIQPDGPLCGCGLHGCVEALASGRAMARRAQEAGIAGSTPELFALAAQGDPKAAALIDAIAADLGRGISIYLTLLNLERVIIGGGAAQAGEALLAPVRRHVDAWLMTPLRGRCQIVPAQLGELAGVIGAASLLPALTAGA